MSRTISLSVKNDNLKINIPIAEYCWNCVVKNGWKHEIKNQDCDFCKNMRINLTENGKKIIGLCQLFLNPYVGTEKIDLQELTDEDRY